MMNWIITMSEETDKILTSRKKSFVRSKGKGQRGVRWNHLERLDNHNYRDRRDLNILKQIKPIVKERKPSDYAPKNMGKRRVDKWKD